MNKRSGLSARQASINAALAASEGTAETMPTTKLVGPSSKRITLSIRLDTDTHEQLRQVAFDRRVSIHSLFLEGVEAILQKYH